MKYIEKVDSRPLYNDGIGYVDLYDFSRANENEESRIEAISLIASICYGKPPRDAKKLAARLMNENASTLEFIRAGTSPGIVWSLRNNPPLDTDLGASILCGMRIAYIQDAHKKNIATFRLKVPVFIARQIMRHRSFSYQELSRRYTDNEHVPLELWRPSTNDDVALIMDLEVNDVMRMSVRTYNGYVKIGMRPEIARAILPQALYTEFWMMGEVEGLKNYFQLRLDKRTQKEHREVAEAMLDLLKEHQPALYERAKP